MLLYLGLWIDLFEELISNLKLNDKKEEAI